MVVSPLLALMTDQAHYLTHTCHIPCVVFSHVHTHTQAERDRVCNALVQRAKKKYYNNNNNNNNNKATTHTHTSGDDNTTPKLMYITPEQLIHPRMIRFLSILARLSYLSLIAIDECHCISSWGHDFRPAYRKLKCLRRAKGKDNKNYKNDSINAFENVPIMALTATATTRVRSDVCRVLRLRRNNCVCVVQSFDRPNIYYDIRCKELLPSPPPLLLSIATHTHTHTHTQRNALSLLKRATITDLTQLLCTNLFCKHQSGIVYCGTRQTTEDIASLLCASGIKAGCYHAGMSASARSEVQTQWMNNTLLVICCTVAFAMGIDKRDVRFVVHFSIPSSLEGYYQESGRAGRDGKPALALLYYSVDDKHRQQYFAKRRRRRRTTTSSRKSSRHTHTSHKSREEKKKMMMKTKMASCNAMIRYCERLYCRRRSILEHFDETYKRNNNNNNNNNYHCCDVCSNPSRARKNMELAQVYHTVTSTYTHTHTRMGSINKEQTIPNTHTHTHMLSRRARKHRDHRRRDDDPSGM